jgi:formyl-CoA transferase
LSGYRVLALEHYLAGNHGTWLMSLFGAEIIKVERPGPGDTLRGVGPFIGTGRTRRSGGELRVMGNKQSIALDLGAEEGRQVFFSLASRCDVVWSNQKPSSLAKLGIDFDSLRRANPEIIYATLSGFGHRDLVDAGPLADLRAFDVIAQGLAGLQFRAASADGAPGYNGLALGDEVTSTLTVLGVVLALLRRERQGGAQRVDVAMHDSMVFLNELALGMLSVLGRTPPRGRSGTSAPYGSFRTTDGWVNIAVGGDPVWRRFCRAIDREDLADDERSSSSSARVANFAWMESLVTDWTSRRTTDEVVSALSAHDVPCGAVLDIPDVLASRQVAARHMMIPVEDPVAGRVSIVGNPVKMNDLPDGVVSAPHEAGQDTAAILTRLLGLTGEEVDGLAERGVIAISQAPGDESS